MMTNPGKTSSSQGAYLTAVEREIGESLQRKLSPPWNLQCQGESLDVRASGAEIAYTPDLLITNETTGQVLAVEIKNSLSLSLANIIKLQDIQSAFQKQGTDFLVVVHGDVPEAAGANARLGEYGINAVGVSRPADAAGEIEKQLQPDSHPPTILSARNGSPQG